MGNILSRLLYTLPAVLLAISLHEFAHGWVSWKLGDPTPKATGRISLNPFHHLDLWGTLCLIVFHFGWAKPVQINPWYYKNRKLGTVLVSLAGPGMNFLLAFLATFLQGVVLRVTGGYVGQAGYYLYMLLAYIAAINLGLGVFNLIPIPPLDGSKVLGALLPEELYFRYMRLEQYGFILLVVLLATPLLDRPLSLATGLLQQLFWWVTGLLL
ncbi:MAG TPA: site-2 protease family protein [Candidatus Anaerotruncus excrementipullorum]|uniref:Site-2 protease family protein n=1 Tax=Candidatus Anaerotruncus excrementipullorum TaxID=2838465 RepID=A0A9D1WSB4_9FIRM|nr:site-2 protease family protein [Candidatus Anaerotruncus excrementipullorum]